MAEHQRSIHIEADPEGYQYVMHLSNQLGRDTRTGKAS